MCDVVPTIAPAGVNATGATACHIEEDSASVSEFQIMTHGAYGDACYTGNTLMEGTPRSLMEG